MIFLRTESGGKEVESWELITSRPNYVDKIIKGDHKLEEIIGYYHFKENLHCGLKGCNQPHQKGYIVRTDIGTETHIGNVCGSNEFGIAFDELASEFTKFMGLEKNKIAVLNAKSKCTEWQSQLDALRRTKPSIDFCAQNIERIQNAHYAGRLAATEVRLLAKSQTGEVTLSEVETNEIARSFLFQTNKSMRESGEATTEYLMGKVSFTNVLLPENELKTLFVTLSEDIKRIVLINLSSAPSPEIAATSQIANGIDERIKKLKIIYHETCKFLTKKNLSAINKKLKHSSTAPEGELIHFESFVRSLGR